MVVCVVAVLCLVERGIGIRIKMNQTECTSEQSFNNAPFASLAYLFQSVSSVLICEGQVPPLLHRRSKHLFKKKTVLNYLLF